MDKTLDDSDMTGRPIKERIFRPQDSQEETNVNKASSSSTPEPTSKSEAARHSTDEGKAEDKSKPDNDESLDEGRLYGVRMCMKTIINPNIQPNSKDRKIAKSKGKSGKSRPCIFMGFLNSEECAVCPLSTFGGISIDDSLKDWSKKDVKMEWVPVVPGDSLYPSDKNYAPITITPQPWVGSYIYLVDKNVMKTFLTKSSDPPQFVEPEDLIRLRKISGFARTYKLEGGGGGGRGDGSGGGRGGGRGGGDRGGGGDRCGGGDRGGDGDGGGGGGEDGEGGEDGGGRKKRRFGGNFEKQGTIGDTKGKSLETRSSGLKNETILPDHPEQQVYREELSGDEGSDDDEEFDWDWKPEFESPFQGTCVEFTEDLNDLDWSWDGCGSFLSEDYKMGFDPMTLECTLPKPKTLDKSILAIRSRETQEVVPEIGVHESITASSPMMEVTDSVVGMEAAPLDLQHSTELNDVSKHSDGAQTEAAEEERLALPANEEDKVMDEEHEGSGGSSSLASPAAGGNEVGGQAQQKNRKKRAKNWTAYETDALVSQVVSAMDERSTRSGMLSQDQWEAISLQVPGRTGEECRERMDTLNKSYASIKKYCDDNGKNFEDLKDEDFQAMQPKPLACFKEEWYIQIRDHCPPRPKKRKTERAESVPRPSTMGSGSAPCTLTLGNTSGERGVQHPHAGPSNVAVTTELTMTAFESTMKSGERSLQNT